MEPLPGEEEEGRESQGEEEVEGGGKNDNFEQAQT